MHSNIVPFEAIRGMDGREADAVIGDKNSGCSAAGNPGKFIERMRAENIHYDFIEAHHFTWLMVVVVNHALNYRWLIAREAHCFLCTLVMRKQK